MREAAAFNHAVQRIKIAGADGVELVVVTARAGDGHALEGFADDVDLVVDDFGLVRADVHRRVAVLTEPPPGGGQPALVPAAILGKAGFDLVAGDVLFHKAVVGHVVIKRADYIIAIAPNFLVCEIKLMPKRLRIAHQIQPVPRPAFAEVRRGQKLIHDHCERLLRVVPQKQINLLRCGRQSGEVKIRAANQRSLVSGTSGF